MPFGINSHVFIQNSVWYGEYESRIITSEKSTTHETEAIKYQHNQNIAST